MDSFAVASHHRLGDAMDNGHLDEIETLYNHSGQYFDHDDGIRRDSSMQSLAKLKPYFDRKYGMVTAGNSAQITDGAAMLLLASAEAVENTGCRYWRASRTANGRDSTPARWVWVRPMPWRR